jgi:hypothetical protein
MTDSEAAREAIEAFDYEYLLGTFDCPFPVKIVDGPVLCEDFSKLDLWFELAPGVPSAMAILFKTWPERAVWAEIARLYSVARRVQAFEDLEADVLLQIKELLGVLYLGDPIPYAYAHWTARLALTAELAATVKRTF